MAEYPLEVYASAWNELYKLYSERLDQENLDIMDSVLKGVVAEMEDENLHLTESNIL